MRVNEYKILLIDDDEDDYIHIRSLLQQIPSSKYVLVWKSNYNDGLATLRENDFDICLLDQRLGAHTGLELLSEVQRVALMGPVIFLTGQGDFDLDIKAMQMGAADYLVKSQLTAPLLERTIRYTIKHNLDMKELKESEAQVLQQDRLASLGLLASSLAHEIGTPLGVIRSRAELTIKRYSHDSSMGQDMLVIVNQIDKIAKMVNSLLHLARGQKSSHSTSVCLNIVVQDVVNLLQHELMRKNILLNNFIDKELYVRAEEGPLGQVLLNLWINSVHAIDEAKKRGKVRGHEITLSVDQKTDHIVLYVKDTGCGISKENLQQIFKPFFTTKDIGQGTGLGLATSYKIIQSWGGSISVESEVDVHTTFKITLPLYKRIDLQATI